MTKKISLWVLFFVFLSFFPSQASALVCYSPKKGAVNHQYYIESSKLGITNLYAYGLEDITPDEAPMLAKDHINRLMANQNPDICNLTTNCNNPNHCCPAKRIREIVQTWGKGLSLIHI